MSRCQRAGPWLWALLLCSLGAPAFAAEATTGIIAGEVTDAAGAPLRHAVVSAAAPTGRDAVTTDDRGRFALLGLRPDAYVVSAQAAGYRAGIREAVRVIAGATQRVRFALAPIATIGTVAASTPAFVVGAPSDTFTVSGAAALASAPATTPSGLASYARGTVQGALAGVPGVDADPFGNAILRGGKVGDAAFEYDAVPIPQGLIAEPGGNVDGAQLPTTGVASTSITLAGYSNESDNALGGVIDQIPAVGTYPARASVEIASGVGTRLQLGSLAYLGATADLRWRYAFAATFGSEDFRYGDGTTFYPAEAGTYGLALQSRSQASLETNVHYQLTPKDDLSLLALWGQAAYQQYASPFPGETTGMFDGAFTTYPGESDPNAPVTSAAGIRGTLDVLAARWTHTGRHLFTSVRLYQTQYGSSSGGPFWDENGFPDGSISLFQTQQQQQYGLTIDNDAIIGPHQVRFGAEARTNTSSLDQVVPTADERISSHPTLLSWLAYAGDTWSPAPRLDLTATARATFTHIKPSTGFAYDSGAVDPHAGVVYRIGSQYALRAQYDRITVAPAPLEADRTDTANVDAAGNAAPFVPLAAETADDFTYSFEGGGRTAFRLTYYAQFEHNLIDVLPFNFRSAVAAGLSPSGVGVPTNAGELRSHGLELYVRHGGLQFEANAQRVFSSSASQFAYNDLNAPAVAAGQLFPVSYVPDFTATLSYAFALAHGRVRVTPSLAYATGYPYGNGTMVWIFDPVTGKPVHVPNDNYVNPGANYYFLADPSRPYDATTNPYIGNLGTNEGEEPDTLRSPPQTYLNLHVEADISKRFTLVLDVANLLGNGRPTAYQSNPYLIGPPGYRGGNAAYASCYGQILAGTVPCAPGTPSGTTPYVLGNGVPTNDGVTQSVPWAYGGAGYVPQSYPLARSVEVRLRYRF